MDRSDILAPIQAVLWKLGLAGAAVFVPMVGFLLWITTRLREEWATAQEESSRASAAEAAMRQSEQRYRHIVDHADRKSTRLNSSHLVISYAVFCLKKKK